LAVASLLAVTMLSPSEEKATEFTSFSCRQGVKERPSETT
jgi:hypothetical protein